MIPLHIVAGPTASGKTALSIELAKKHNGEIICADSMQIYKYMDIGTAKPTLEEQQGIPHHLFGIVDPNCTFSVAQYADLAHKTIAEIHSRNKLPILVGGTGLYIDTVANNIILSEANHDEEYRHELTQIVQEKGNDFLFNMLVEIDPPQADRLSPSDVKRIIRALEIYKITGKTKTEHDILSKSAPQKYTTTQVGIRMERERLYDRINRRVNMMIKDGLVGEVEKLRSIINNPDKTTSMQGIGYKEIMAYIDGYTSLEQAIELIKKRTRNYAKRQLTWFNRNENMIWIEK